MNKIRIALLLISMQIMTGCNSKGQVEKHEDHDGHENHSEVKTQIDAEDYEVHEGHDDHEGDDNHNDHDDHDDQTGHSEDEIEVSLSKKGVEIAGIKIDTVQVGRIQKTIELAGEVGLNEDELAHVVPRFPGIVKQVHKKLGDYVKKGDVLAVIESNESLSEYFIKAQISGRVIEKHITLGEYVSEETSVYVIANLSTVWVNLSVYAKDAMHVKKGQLAKLQVVGNDLESEGAISYIGQVFNEQTRNLVARIVLKNKSGKWKPGSFVKGVIPITTDSMSIIVSESAVQIVQEELCVFVPVQGESFTYKKVDVEVGERDGKFIQILSGLHYGDDYVSQGAFEIKSKIITSSLGGHAGHGH